MAAQMKDLKPDTPIILLFGGAAEPVEDVPVVDVFVRKLASPNNKKKPNLLKQTGSAGIPQLPTQPSSKGRVPMRRIGPASQARKLTAKRKKCPHDAYFRTWERIVQRAEHGRRDE